MRLRLPFRRRTSVEVDVAPLGETRRELVDAATRTWWSGGGPAAATLVEVEDEPVTIPGRRAAALVDAHERGRPADRPRANPAFSEALFVELMRAHQYQRAYEQLAPDCQRSWGGAEAFAAAQRRQAVSRVRGVDVKGVRYVDGWVDPTTHLRHDHAAELDVEYTIGEPPQQTVLRRSVHLVGHAGKWRSLCYRNDSPAS